MNIPQTPRQRTKSKALEQKAEINEITKFHHKKDAGETNMAPTWKPGQYERIYRGSNEIQSD